MSRGYDIYKKLKYDYFTWIANEPTHAEAARATQILNSQSGDDSVYFAVAKRSPSLLAIAPVATGRP